MTALALMASLLATTQSTQSLDLAGHLRALGAPRAAQRLDGGPPPVAPTPFTVDSSKVYLVADEAAAAAFSAAVSEAAAIALDCEWRPDGPGEDHAVALAQVATKSSVWLVDFVELSGLVNNRARRTDGRPPVARHVDRRVLYKFRRVEAVDCAA